MPAQIMKVYVIGKGIHQGRVRLLSPGDAFVTSPTSAVTFLYPGEVDMAAQHAWDMFKKTEMDAATRSAFKMQLRAVADTQEDFPD